MRKFVVYSHGFGVRKDDRGLFTDIAAHFSEDTHVMFDYNVIDEGNNALTAAPLDEQAIKLRRIIGQIQSKQPDAIIDLICHSQGCVAAALANAENTHKTIFLAPPAQFLGLEKKEMYKLRPATVAEADGTIRFPRRDGSITIINEKYWQSRAGIRPIALYNDLSKRTELIIVNAQNDEVLTKTDFSGLSENIRVVELAANHDFTSEARPELLKFLDNLL